MKGAADLTAVTLEKSPSQPSSSRAFRIWVSVLVALLVLGLAAASQVLLRGLQVTDLSDRVPWGLWITLDLSMIALGAGAFTFSAAVYIFRIKIFLPLARPAVFIGFLGYSRACSPSR